MVDAYKTRTPQAKGAQPRESAREKLDALVKDTAAKAASVHKYLRKTCSMTQFLNDRMICWYQPILPSGATASRSD